MKKPVQHPTNTPSGALFPLASPPASVPFLVVRHRDTLVRVLEDRRNAPILGIDTETTGLDPLQSRIRLLQIAAPPHPVAVVDLFALSGTALPPLLAPLLEGSGVKVFQNAVFDLAFLRNLGCRVTGPLFDTMLAAQLLAEGISVGGFGLDDLADRFLGEELPKEQRHSNWTAPTLSHEQILYAARDAAILPRLRERMIPLLRERNLIAAAKLEFDCLSAVVDMHLSGILLDQERFSGLLNDLRQEAAAAEEVLRRALAEKPIRGQQLLFGALAPEINLESPRQLLEAFRRLGIPLRSTSRGELDRWAGDHPAVGALKTYRKAAKSLLAFGEGLLERIHPVSGRLHPHYAQISTPTGRFACGGPNIQQIPRETRFRRCFTAPSGRSLVIADYSQIELRVAAEMAPDEGMIEAYGKKEDLHLRTAALLLGKSPHDVSRSERQMAKAVNFGLLFGMGAPGLRRYAASSYGVHLSDDEAHHFRQRFFEVYPGLAAWHLRESTSQGLELRTRSGRCRRIAADEGLSGRLNTPIQGTAADILKAALGALPRILDRYDGSIVGCVHDEILLEVPEDRAQETALLLAQTMISAGERFLLHVPVEVEVHVGASWAEK